MICFTWCFHWFACFKRTSKTDTVSQPSTSCRDIPPNEYIPPTFQDELVCVREDPCCKAKQLRIEHESETLKLKDIIRCGLEELHLFHCHVPQIDESFPDSLRVINITFSRVKRFQSCCLPDGLAEINLSFNNLLEIPSCVYDAFMRNPKMKINMSHNDFWFSAYSHLPPSLISPKTVNELMRAHRMNLVSTEKVRYAVNVLQEKKFVAEASDLARKIGMQLQERSEQGGCTWENKENVHLTSVNDAMKETIQKLFEISTPPNEDSSDTILTILRDCELKKYVQNDMATNPFYASLVDKVYSVAKMYNVDMDILVTELREGMIEEVCSTGKLRKIVGALNGYVPGLYVGISKNEEIANSIIVIRNRNSKVYGDDIDLYLSETIPEVLQLLEDACVSVAEQTSWLEYV